MIIKDFFREQEMNWEMLFNGNNAIIERILCTNEKKVLFFMYKYFSLIQDTDNEKRDLQVSRNIIYTHIKSPSSFHSNVKALSVNEK